jgi:hypothetical protein
MARITMKMASFFIVGPFIEPPPFSLFQWMKSPYAGSSDHVGSEGAGGSRDGG